MSYTEIYRITKSGNTKLAGQIRNSFRGAMAIWNALEEKYLPPYAPYGFKMSRMITDGKMQEVWDLSKDSRLSEDERIVLISTFDNVLVEKKDFNRLCEAFRNFKHETSLTEQAEIIEKLSMDKNTYGVCWNQTSVNADIPDKNVKERYWNLFEDLKQTTP